MMQQLRVEFEQLINELEQLWRDCGEDKAEFLKAIAEKWQESDPRLFAFLTSKTEGVKKSIDWDEVKKGKNRPNVPVNKDGDV